MGTKKRDAARCANTGGVEVETGLSNAVFRLGTYHETRDLQARWLRRTRGLSCSTAAVVADLLFGEVTR